MCAAWWSARRTFGLLLGWISDGLCRLHIFGSSLSTPQSNLIAAKSKDYYQSRRPELKTTTHLLINHLPEEELYITACLLKYSTLGRLQRVMGYMLRFIHICRRKEKLSGPLSVGELENSLHQCVRLFQLRDFAAEIKALESSKTISLRVSTLSPFLNNNKILRVGGRLKNSLLSENQKHTILLSKNSHLSKLICQHYHHALLHAGPRTTRAIIQRKFWILSLHGLLRKLIHQCLTCVRWQAKPHNPLMGDLPAPRVQVSRCFASTTMDLAGPFSIKETLRRKNPVHKTYFAVFVCEATKAVHLELVSDLTTDASFAAFHRFVSRQSSPYVLRSDNGRNFIGARRVLKECQQFLEAHDSEIYSELSSRNVLWKLNPPRGAHLGGLHEAAVKSAKFLLYKVVGDATLTMEEFMTLLARIEAVLNNRPLSFVDSDPAEGLDYLSPGHFLVGGSLVSTPEKPLDLEDTTKNRWIGVQQMAQSFLKRYQKEYLHSLMQREKWSRNVSNIQVDQLVYLMGEKTSPMSWPLGRVVAIYPGADGVVRVVDIKTSSGVYRRPVCKLVLIPNEF